MGKVKIAGSGYSNVDLSNVQAFYGDLTMNGTDVVSFVAPNLQLVSGDFELTFNHLLQTLNLAQLATVNAFTLTALPALTNVGLTSGITTAQLIVISDTGLNSLDGINVFSLKVFNVNNNGAIATINSGLQKVTDQLIITDNGKDAVVTMNKLTAVNDLTLGKVSNFTVGNLTSINGSIAISQSYMQSIDLSQIKAINNSLTIYSNDNLNSLNFSSLQSLGGALQISENPQLKSFQGSFASLKTVGGAVLINGTFDNGTFESLQNVAGGFSFISTDGDLSCDEFNKLNKNGDIKGNSYICSGAGTASSSSTGTAKASGLTSTGGLASSSTKSSSSKKSDASKASQGLIAMLLTTVAALGLAI